MLKRDASPFQILQWLASVRPGRTPAGKDQMARGFRQFKARDGFTLPMPLPDPQGRRQIIVLPGDGGLPTQGQSGTGTGTATSSSSSTGSSGSATGSNSSSPSSSSSSDSASSASSGSSSTPSSTSSGSDTGTGIEFSDLSGESFDPPDLCEEFDLGYRTPASGMGEEDLPLHRLLGANWYTRLRGSGTAACYVYDASVLPGIGGTAFGTAPYVGSGVPCLITYNYEVRETVTCNPATGIKTRTYTGSMKVTGHVEWRDKDVDAHALPRTENILKTITLDAAWISLNSVPDGWEGIATFDINEDAPTTLYELDLMFHRLAIGEFMQEFRGRFVPGFPTWDDSLIPDWQTQVTACWIGLANFSMNDNYDASGNVYNRVAEIEDKSFPTTGPPTLMAALPLFGYAYHNVAEGEWFTGAFGWPTCTRRATYSGVDRGNLRFELDWEFIPPGFGGNVRVETSYVCTAEFFPT